MAPASPTVARWELSLRLRERRRKLGLSAAAIAETLGFTRNYWSLVENDKTLIADEKLRGLFDLLDFDEAERADLLDLRATGRQRGWWMDYADLLDDDQLRLYGLEYGATSVRAYEGDIITGLLQTRSYARALMVNDPFVSKGQTDRRIELRMTRQARLEGPDPLTLTAVMSQAALAQHVSSDPTILLDQLEHLAAMAEREADHVTIRIIPFTANPGAVLGSSTFFLLDFASPHLPVLSWRESMNSIGVGEDDRLVRELALRYQEALAASLSPSNSAELIRSHLNQMKADQAS